MLEREMRNNLIIRYRDTCRITPIESPGTLRSIPDLQIRSYTADWWVELKRLDKVFTTQEVRIPWRPGQLKWIEAHYSYGGNVALVLSIFNIFYIVDGIRIWEYYKDIDALKRISSAYGTIEQLPIDLWEV